MKIRSAFISNSSSSSFIFVFNRDQKVPSTEKEVEEFLSINPLIKENKLYSYQYYDEPITVSSIIDYILSSFNSAKIQDSPIKTELNGKFDYENYNKTIYEVFHRLINNIVYWETEMIRRKELKGRCFSDQEDTIENTVLILKRLGFKNINVDKFKVLAKLSYEYDKISNENYYPRYHKILKQLLEKYNITSEDSTKKENEELCKKIYKEQEQDSELKKLNNKLKELNKSQYEIINQLEKEIVNDFFKDNPSKKLVAIECSDNDSTPGSCCEHGEIFKYHNCLIVSNH